MVIRCRQIEIDNRDQARKAKAPIEGEQQREHAAPPWRSEPAVSGSTCASSDSVAGGAAVDHAAQGSPVAWASK